LQGRPGAERAVAKHPLFNRALDGPSLKMGHLLAGRKG